MIRFSVFNCLFLKLILFYITTLITYKKKTSADWPKFSGDSELVGRAYDSRKVTAGDP